MGVLTEKTVRLRAKAADRADAIKQAGRLLVAAGYVSPDYVEGMLARERMASNYLGNGIAIPHGRLEDLKHVYHTGLSVLQLPQGVEWNAGERAYLVIGLAAISNEYVVILTNLVELLQNIEDIHHLIQSDDPMVIIKRLTRGQDATA